MNALNPSPWDAATDAPHAVGEYAVHDIDGAVRRVWWSEVGEPLRGQDLGDPSLFTVLAGQRWLFLRGPSELPAAPPSTAAHPSLPPLRGGWRWVERPSEDGGWAAAEVGAFGVVVRIRGGELHVSGRAPLDVIDAVRRVAGCAP